MLFSVSFLFHLTNLTFFFGCKLGEKDCLEVDDHSEKDALKTFVDLKPKVMQDFTAIIGKFPCNDYAHPLLQFFVSGFFRNAMMSQIISQTFQLLRLF